MLLNIQGAQKLQEQHDIHYEWIEISKNTKSQLNVLQF